MNLTKSIRQIMFACGTAAFAAGSLAAVGLQNPPPGPGQIPDYFGVTGNYANSPEPVLATVAITGTGTGAIAAATTYDYQSLNPGAYTGGITDVQILNGGTGYLNGGNGYDNATTTVTVNGGLGVTPVTGLTAEVYKGVIVGIKEFNPYLRDLTPNTGTGLNTATPNPSYIGNLATPVTFLGTGFTVPVTGTGLKKFVDLLPGIPGVSSYTTASGYTAGVTPLGQALPVAVPDTTTFPGSDYYEIAEKAYTQQLHSSLPATHLRGYKQLNAPAGSASASNQYLGPIIVAHKNRPVRVKLVNQLPLKGSAGLGDQLPFPVDHTYMGAAGATDTDNRTALHMHGATPLGSVMVHHASGLNRLVKRVPTKASVPPTCLICILPLQGQLYPPVLRPLPRAVHCLPANRKPNCQQEPLPIRVTALLLSSLPTSKAPA